MPKPAIIGFLDLALLSTALFWIAATRSQVAFEEAVLPVSYSVSAPTDSELDQDVQVLNIRWFGPGPLPSHVLARYEGSPAEKWVGLEGPHSDVIWMGETLYPAILHDGFYNCMRNGRPDLYWKVRKTLETWHQGDAVLIRADRNLPFKHISRVLNVFTMEAIQIERFSFGVAIGH